MTIDEAIAHERKEEKAYRENENIIKLQFNPNETMYENAEYYKVRADYHNQIIDWLEELKQLRNQQTEVEICRKFAESLKEKHYSLCALQDEENYQYPSYLEITDIYKHIDEVLAEMETE